MPSEPDHHDLQFQMISCTPMRRASAWGSPFASGASRRLISRSAARRSAGLRTSRCQSIARPSACRLKLRPESRSQRMMPQLTPRTLRPSQLSIASVPFAGRFTHLRAWS